METLKDRWIGLEEPMERDRDRDRDRGTDPEGLEQEMAERIIIGRIGTLGGVGEREGWTGGQTVEGQGPTIGVDPHQVTKGQMAKGTRKEGNRTHRCLFDYIPDYSVPNTHILHFSVSYHLFYVFYPYQTYIFTHIFVSNHPEAGGGADGADATQQLLQLQCCRYRYR